MCLDNELVLSDPPEHPVSLRVTLLGVTLTCTTVWTTFQHQDGGSRSDGGNRMDEVPQPSLSQLGNQGTASFALHLVLLRTQEVQLLQQD